MRKAFGAFLAIALVAVSVSLGSWKRPQGRYDLSLLLIACALVTFAFWAFSSLKQSAWTLYALYVWSGLVGTLTGLQFWLVLGEVYTVTQAKRIYKLVGAGSVLGAVAGAGRGDKPFTKAGKKWFSFRSFSKAYFNVRGVAMNAVDHPHGGGSHQHVGKPSTVGFDAPPGRKVGRMSPQPKRIREKRRRR